ncbi:TPA: DHA2 family efflux MFS transporter permease subunit [Legionella pneumophila]|nr:DHA2 family efflux MFS transporter permease subunit [Legionella pneumophila]HDU7929989.1 DHA2 family efflux MFS transporter permease subunit [Legionella pneumophila]HDU7934724.1 DHA2 family efflux MFS transporter permease subunit [Legionella pneumophila]HDU7961689.1 DHA2 family efflux MFS transporter permease subunit [Legionella pneumophila]HEG4428571.1 DHA2 family efflux MFS transporter permease subunit [Legionella pneumophila]
MNNPSDTLSASQRWIITVAIMAATLMQVLDTTIVNVALPHMQGSLGASPDETTWTLTSYLVASAIFMPLTGYFTDRFGRKAYLLLSIIGFTLTSALCGAATSIVQMVVFRLLQGIFGAGLVPLSQAILTDIFPDNERGKAMAIWGMGVMVGPILGPSLGGYLTDIASWRWTFYVNIPFGIAATLMVFHFVPDTLKKARKMDWIGMILIALAVGSIQYVLDRGNQMDWFAALDIRTATFLGLISLCGFIAYSIKNKSNALFDISIFQDRNFVLSSLLLAILGLGMYGTMVIQPQMLQGLLDYPVLIAGLIMAPRGIASMFSMMIVGKLTNQVQPRWLISIGVLLSASGIYIMTHYSQDVSLSWLIWPLILQGFGLGLIFVPLSSVAFSTLPSSARSEAAGLYSLLRTIGSSVGISITITFLSRHTQIAWNQIGGSIQLYNPALMEYLQPWHLKATDPQAAALLLNELGKQSLMLSYINTFAFIMWSFLIMLPFVLLLKQNNSPATSILSE